MRLAPMITCLALVSAPVYGHVIEIDDDGATIVYDGPTLPITEPALVSARATAVVEQADSFDLAARAYGVDVGLLRAVAWTESRGRNDAVSPKGAMGIMQLMPGTAAELGVDPRDPRSNIAGGAAYLAQQIQRFGSVPLGLAAYNAGPGAVLRWRGIPPYSETKGYVASVLQRWRGLAPLARPPAHPAPTAPIVPVLLMEVQTQ